MNILLLMVVFAVLFIFGAINFWFRQKTANEIIKVVRTKKNTCQKGGEGCFEVKGENDPLAYLAKKTYRGTISSKGALLR